MTTITFGFRIDRIDDPLVSRALKLSREFMCVYLTFLVNDINSDP